eukprot:887486-Rhodomonas_salina.4
MHASCQSSSTPQSTPPHLHALTSPELLFTLDENLHSDGTHTFQNRARLSGDGGAGIRTTASLAAEGTMLRRFRAHMRTVQTQRSKEVHIYHPNPSLPCYPCPPTGRRGTAVGYGPMRLLRAVRY